MTYVATVLGWLKVAWPYISLVVSLLGGIHAGSAQVQIPSGPESSFSQQAERATHVYGVGGLAAAAGVAGVIGLRKGGKKACPVLKQLGTAYAAMLEEDGAGDDLTELNAIILKRKGRK